MAVSSRMASFFINQLRALALKIRDLLEAFEAAKEIVLEVFVEGVDDGAYLFQLLFIKIVEDGAVCYGELCVADLSAKVSEEFNLGLGGGDIADLFGGGTEDLAESFFG